MDDVLQGIAYVSMGWLNFLLFLTLFRDLIGLLTPWLLPPPWVLLASFLALGLGMLIALRGPRIVTIDIPIADLDPRLEGLCLAQISDLHVSNIRAALMFSASSTRSIR